MLMKVTMVAADGEGTQGSATVAPPSIVSLFGCYVAAAAFCSVGVGHQWHHPESADGVGLSFVVGDGHFL